MKKILALLLMLAMLLSLAACGGDESNSDDDEDEDEISDKDRNDDDDEDEDDDRDLFDLKNLSFDGLTAIDNDVCKIEVTDLEYDEYLGYDFTISLENKTEGELTFTYESASAHGVQLNSLSLYSSVLAGEKVNENVQIKEPELEACGFYKLSAIEVTFVVENEEYDEVARETVTLYPYGEDAAAEDFARAEQEDDFLLIDNEYITVIAYDHETDELYDAFVLKYYVINKTDAIIWFNIEDVWVNDCEFSAIDIEEIYPENAWFGELIVWDTELEENNVEKVEKIDFTVEVHTYDDRYEDNDQFAEEDISLNILR